MGGYKISYETFETYVQKQSIAANRELELYQRALVDGYKCLAGSYTGAAEARRDAVFELAEYLDVPEEEVKRIWAEAEK